MDALEMGKKIVQQRKEKGITQKQLAEKLHVTDKAVSKWERGINFPDLTLMQSLADVLEISVTELLGLETPSSDDVVNRVIEISLFRKQSKKTLIRLLKFFAIFEAILAYGIIGMQWFVDTVIIPLNDYAKQKPFLPLLRVKYYFYLVAQFTAPLIFLTVVWVLLELLRRSGNK